MFAADRMKLPVINHPTALLLLKADPPQTPDVSCQAAKNQHSAFTSGAQRPLVCVTGCWFMLPPPSESTCGTAGPLFWGLSASMLEVLRLGTWSMEL